ncbi:MAG: hypothetical protein JST00_15385 [Deltaproteobacteria bacterium]|nr:hypothetical protein [Deltaproteobacteria bacterium]
MTSDRRRRLIGFAVAFAMITAAVPPALAQSPEELKQARELFQEAYKDEQEKRFEQALEKFRRVAKVRESAPVRYRIASVLEGMGRLREARDAFRALAASKPTLAASEHEVADSAAARVVEIDKKIPHVIVKLDPSWPQDTRVTVDGGIVPANPGPRGVEIDPGSHVIGAMSPKTGPAESTVTVAEGGEVTVNLLPPQSAPSPVTPPKKEASTDTPPADTRTAGYIVLAAGGALVVGGAVMLIVREGKISDIESTCPNGVCPTATRADVESARDGAKTLAPLGIGFLVTGILAGGVGTYLVLRSGGSEPPPPKPTARLRVGGGSVPGGGIVALQGLF